MKAILLSADLAKDSELIDAPDLAGLIRVSGIEFFEIIRTSPMSEYFNVVMLVEDDGLRMELPFNLRGHTVAGYPGPIVGNVLIMREVPGPDGFDLVGITDEDFDKMVVQSELDELCRNAVVNGEAPSQS